MDTVFLRSGRVDCILGANVVDARGKVVGYTGRDSSTGSFTASIAGNVLTVTVVTTGGIYPGNVVAGTGIPLGTYVTEQLSGTVEGVGTYRLSNDATYAPITFASGAITTDASGLAKYKDSPWTTFQAVLQGTSGALTAVVNIYASNDANFWCATPIGTITLSATGPASASDGFTTVAPWKYIKAVLTTLTGTGASVYVTEGV